ncbi:hypothetical protein GCM10027068_52580 [Prescottella soli]
MHDWTGTTSTERNGPDPVLPGTGAVDSAGHSPQVFRPRTRSFSPTAFNCRRPFVPQPAVDSRFRQIERFSDVGSGDTHPLAALTLVAHGIGWDTRMVDPRQSDHESSPIG